MVAISCWPRLLRTISSPLESGAYRSARSASRESRPRMVAPSDFSGLVSSAWAFASAAAIAPIVSLERCMGRLHVHEIEAHRPGFGALGPDPVPDRLLGVLGHDGLEVGLGPFMLEKCRAGGAKYGRQIGPRVRRAHVDDPHRRDAGPGWLDPKNMRGLTNLDAAPEFLLRRQKEVLV